LHFNQPSLKYLPKQINTELKNKLNDFEIKDSYLQKYKMKDLNNLFNRLLEKEIRKKELIIIFYLINIISDRYKEYQQITGNCNKNISPKQLMSFFHLPN